MRRLLALALGLCATAASAATFTVTNTSDYRRGDRCARRSQPPTARRALDTIAFNVSGDGCDGGGVCTIALDSALPDDHEPGPHRRLHAAGRIAQHATRPERSTRS